MNVSKILASPTITTNVLRILAPRLPQIGASLLVQRGWSLRSRQSHRFYSEKANNETPLKKEGESTRKASDEATASSNDNAAPPLSSNTNDKNKQPNVAVSHAMLATREQEANKDLTSPDAQAAF